MNDKLTGTRTIVFDLDDVQVARTEDANGTLWEMTYSRSAGDDVLAQARSCMPSRGEYLEVEVGEDVTFFRFLELTGCA